MTDTPPPVVPAVAPPTARLRFRLLEAANAASIAVAQRLHAARREFTSAQGRRLLFYTERQDRDARSVRGASPPQR